eukprot:TRINITY_DN135826_c0_g1_i1.p1 TRINITY_DN135826_c0_g1~~TRINITY_DN135826_c0_g1_i1.p1  ORF type:complete len:417 (+),score=31.27 TRINITY_DN135826_c0_g1_i1:98-1252(+)
MSTSNTLPFLLRNWRTALPPTKSSTPPAHSYYFFHNLPNAEFSLAAYNASSLIRDYGPVEGAPTFCRMHIKAPLCPICFFRFPTAALAFLHCLTTHAKHYAFYHKVLVNDSGARALLVFCLDLNESTILKGPMQDSTEDEKKSIQGYYNRKYRLGRAHELFVKSDLTNLLDEEMADSMLGLLPSWREHVRMIIPCLKPFGVVDPEKGRRKMMSQASSPDNPPEPSTNPNIYYHSTSGEEMGINDPLSDDEEVIKNPSWLTEYENKAIDKLPIAVTDKEFYKVWNKYMNKANPNRGISGRDLFACCIKFCKEHAMELMGRRENMVWHLLGMAEYRLLSPDDVYNIIVEFDAQQRVMKAVLKQGKVEVVQLLVLQILDIFLAVSFF